jgi:tellurite resistance protein TehA-like permease
MGVMDAPAAPARVASDRIATLHPAWGASLMSVSGAALVSLRDPLPGVALDAIVGVVLLALAAVVAVALTIATMVRVVRYNDAFLADLANPGIGAMIASWPAGLQVFALAVLQAGVSGALVREVALVVGLVAFIPGVLGTLVSGYAFYTRIIGVAEVPPAAVSGNWFVPVVPLVLVPSILLRALELGMPGDARTWAFVSLIGWGIGFTLFLMLASIIGSRLLVAAPPSAHQAPSWWGWLAPLGAGGVGLLASVELATAAGVIEGADGMALLLVTVMWGFSAWWVLLAMRIIVKERGSMHFHLGWWGFGFPTAAFVNLTAVVARSWELPGLAAIDPVLWVAVIAAIVVLIVLTVRGLRTGATWAR